MPDALRLICKTIGFTTGGVCRLDQGPPRSGRAATAAFALALCAVVSRRAVGADSAAISELRCAVTRWGTEQGLPQNSIVDMTMTRDGYLWLATFNGLARFDGVHFEVFNPVNTPALPSGRIISLVADPAGALWVSTEDGSITRVANGRFEPANGHWGLPARDLSAVGLDPDGNVWFEGGTTYHNSPAGFVAGELFDPAKGDRVENCEATRACGWIRRNGVLRLFPIHDLTAALGDGRFRVVQGVTRNGRLLWLGADEIHRPRENKIIRLSRSIQSLWPVNLVEDGSGNYWVATWLGGLLEVTADGSVFRVPLMDSANPVAIRCLRMDDENNLWVGTDLYGVIRVRRRIFATFGGGNRTQENVIKSVFGAGNGRVWLVNNSGLDELSPDGNVNTRAELRFAWTVARSREGRVFLGTFDGRLCEYRDGALVDYHYTGDGNVGAIQTLAFDSSNQLWLGTRKGLRRLEGANIVPAGLPPSFGVPNIRVIAWDSHGRCYLGLDGGGILRRDGDRWERFSKTNGLADDHIYSLYVDTNDVVWAGTANGGLSRFAKGRFFNCNSPASPLPDSVSGIAGDAAGNLWLGSLNGIYRVARAGLDALATGGERGITCQRYGLEDGLGSVECAAGMQPTIYNTPDGRLWFATINGASVVDPAAIPMNRTPPPVVIEKVLLEDRDLSSAAAFTGEVFSDPPFHSAPPVTSLALPPGGPRFEIRYTALSYTAPEKIRFKYRLDGLDHDWNDAGGRRAAYYQNLGPGTYRFRVIACNDDGVWNQIGARIDLMVAPFFWQTWWFAAVVAAGIGGILFSAHRARVGALERRRLAQQDFSRRLIESQEQERKRIASELHDGLGQDLLVIKNRATVALGQTGGSKAAGEQLGEISSVTSQAIRTVREMAHNLRPYQLDELGLTRAVESMAAKVLRSAGIGFQPELHPIDGLLPPEFEISLFRMIQEILNNVVKHSGARQAGLRLAGDGRSVRLRVEDDGRGFEPQSLIGGAAAFGLTGLRERAELMGGRCEFASTPGRGTVVTVEVPTGKTG